ncbi:MULTISPECIES: hypothetical protein [Microbacterium]|uniref:hypothetical protein n=1 Tax=Microbacterium TaxID=33882 RepID=UPI00278963C0|nr:MULTISPECIES: hypothetical protein [Microbacterium]MDQ1084837.1 hypothetical protein [Microbacterium sp. SORGH_AS_0344]MDQ1169883.1 hypothetical protein [Microbacterium proteolyticum]
MNTPADRLPGADEENIVPESEGLAADVPAGAAGADTGAVGAAEIDADDEARLQNISSQNDLPGVGTRAADGLTERGTDDARGESGSTSRHTEDTGAPTHDGPETDNRTPASPPVDRDGAEPHVDGDDPIAKYQPGVGRDSAASSRIAQNLPDPDDA